MYMVSHLSIVCPRECIIALSSFFYILVAGYFIFLNINLQPYMYVLYSVLFLPFLIMCIVNQLLMCHNIIAVHQL